LTIIKLHLQQSVIAFILVTVIYVVNDTATLQ